MILSGLSGRVFRPATLAGESRVMCHRIWFLYLAERCAGSGGGISHDPTSGRASHYLTRLVYPRAGSKIAIPHSTSP